jgi:glycosyltransferase involved in cell wall biosynthesis
MLQRRLWRRGRGAFNAIVCCSSAIRAQLDADGIETYDVIWPGTTHAPRRAPRRGPPTVTYAGRLTREKGVDLLVRAFRLVRDRCPDARLLITGSGPAEPDLRALVGELRLTDCVRLNGQLEGAGLEAVLAQGWVHAVPSRWAEPFGLTATEAMMRGTAVVASDIGGLADSVQHGVTGLHVSAGDEHALADALTALLLDRARTERMGAAGASRARALFSIDACATRFEALYESLIPSTSRTVHVG